MAEITFETTRIERTILAQGNYADIVFANPNYGTANDNIRAEFEPLTSVGNCQLMIFGSNNKSEWSHIITTFAYGDGITNNLTPVIETGASSDYKYYRFYIKNNEGSIALANYVTAPFEPGMSSYGTAKVTVTVYSPTSGDSGEQGTVTNPEYALRNLGAGGFYCGDWAEVGFENPYYPQTGTKIRAVFQSLTDECYNSLRKVYGSNDKIEWELLNSVESIRMGAETLSDPPTIETTNTSYRYYKFYINNQAAVGYLANAGELTENFFEVPTPFGVPAIKVTVYGTFTGSGTTSQGANTTYESTTGKGYLDHGEHSEIIIYNPNYGNTGDWEFSLTSLTRGGLCQYTVHWSNDKTEWTMLTTGECGADGIYDTFIPKINITNRNHKYYKVYVKNISQDIGINGKIALANGYTSSFELADTTYGIPHIKAKNTYIMTRNIGLPYEPQKWNIPGVELENNCYSYAIDIIGGGWAPDNYDNLIDQSGLSYSKALETAFLASAESRNMTIPGKKQLYTNQSTALAETPNGAYVVAAFLSGLGREYHFLRLNAGGTSWSHKNNSEPVTNLDGNNNLIIDPENYALAPKEQTIYHLVGYFILRKNE